jgi:hypothetical protein
MAPSRGSGGIWSYAMSRWEGVSPVVTRLKMVLDEPGRRTLLRRHPRALFLPFAALGSLVAQRAVSARQTMSPRRVGSWIQGRSISATHSASRIPFARWSSSSGLSPDRKSGCAKSTSESVETHGATRALTHTVTHTPADRRSPARPQSLPGFTAPPGLEPGLSVFEDSLPRGDDHT